MGTSSATLLLTVDDAQISAADLNSFFNWAEMEAPSLFAPGGQATTAYAGYQMRYYPGTKSYLGVKSGRVYYSGPLSGGQGLELGSFSGFLSTAKAAGY
jgi:hypothetical protein